MGWFQYVKKAALWLDRFIENLALSAAALMTIIVTVKVLTRKLFHFDFYWSDEIILLLFIWFSFLGIAIGFRDHLHIAMDSFTRLFPKPFNRVLDYVIWVSMFLFGVYLIVYGWDFAKLMHPNTMTATKWPGSVPYIISPITGVLICVYSLLQMLGVDTARHRHLDEGVGE
jgi:TRAP-type C4-dicarboxylate transport system permease small subunit